jgi:ankyrin repeat protein
MKKQLAQEAAQKRPLVRAIELHQIEIVRELLEAGAHPDLGGRNRCY